MRLVIIILVLVVIGFAVAIGVGVARGGQSPSAGGGPPTRNGEIDKDALETWSPPPMAGLLGKLMSPFAPKLLKAQVEISGQAGSGLQGDTPGRFEVEPATKDMRIARLRLISGAAAKAVYDCVEQDGRTCPQTVCLCASSSTLDAGDVDDCPSAWLRARRPEGSDRLQCKKDDDAVALVIYREGGAISVMPLAGESATVSIH